LVTMLLVHLVRFTIDSSRAQARAVAAQQDVAIVDQALRALIEAADPGAPTGGPARFDGTPARLSFVTALPDGAPPPTPQAAEVTLALNEAHQLTLRWTPRLAALAQQAVPARTSVLLDNVARLEIGYRAPDGQGGGWLPQWRAPGLPGLIRIRIERAGPAGRALPDIVIAPRRERPDL